MDTDLIGIALREGPLAAAILYGLWQINHTMRDGFANLRADVARLLQRETDRGS